MAKARVASRHFILTGLPGVGKTTLMVKLQKELANKGLHCSGFVTEEVRVSRRRIGFDVVTMNGQRGHLARISDPPSNVPSARQREYKVGQYTVNILSFEQTALPSIQLQIKDSVDKERKQLFFVDEIGKMELFSQNFVQAVRKLTSQPNVIVIATIPVPKGKPIPFVEELRNGANSVVFEVTLQNRDTILENVMAAIQASTES
uniref:AAA+ ATPase domain-containing protein n=1 Tax=Arion vulgaris TaxID=1028688 RepID=A0A0B6Z225_9EUPU